MRKPFIPGGMRTLKSQQGNILIITVFIMLVIFILIAGMVEIGRVMIAREQLQTATDAAALAGANSGTHRYVKINVVTDRGTYEHCNSDDECSCSSCGTVTIHNIVGDEKTLIDNEGWKDFCIPPCDCSPGECYFELVSRDMMYDTYSMGWGSSAEEIDNTEKDLTQAVVDMISGYLYGFSDDVQKMLAGKSLVQIFSVVSNQNRWHTTWMAQKGYGATCPCYYRYGCDQVCIAWANAGAEQYMKINTIKNGKTKADVVKAIIDTLDNMRAVNTKSITRIDPSYTGAAGAFFEANLPTIASGAGIQKIKVYGYESKETPYYPSVVIYATAQIKPLFPQWFTQDIKTTVCGQGTTSYRDPNDQTNAGNHFTSSLNFGKWHYLPEKACWVDW